MKCNTAPIEGGDGVLVRGYEMKTVIKDYVCFDLETTGFGKYAEIIDIGAVKVRNLEIVDTFSELVKPVHYISNQITELTGISQQDVINCRSVKDVLSNFIDFIGDDVLIGYNIASFDLPIIKRIAANVLGVKLEPKYIDTMRLVKPCMGLCDRKLQTMLDHYGIINTRAHRAFEDSKATHELYIALLGDGATPYPSISYYTPTIVEDKPKEELEVKWSSEKLDNINGMRVVLTGDFAAGTREQVTTKLMDNGANISSSLSAKIDYLIVGSHGSNMWTFKNGGKKIQQAIDIGVKIIAEDHVLVLKEKNHV